MADTNAPVQELQMREITSSPTIIEDKNTITVLNGSSTDVLTIGASAGSSLDATLSIMEIT